MVLEVLLLSEEERRDRLEQEQFVVRESRSRSPSEVTALQQKRHKLAHVIILPEDNLKVKKTVVPTTPILEITDDVLVVLGNTEH